MGRGQLLCGALALGPRTANAMGLGHRPGTNSTIVDKQAGEEERIGRYGIAAIATITAIHCLYQWKRKRTRAPQTNPPSPAPVNMTDTETGQGERQPLLPTATRGHIKHGHETAPEPTHTNTRLLEDIPGAEGVTVVCSESGQTRHEVIFERTGRQERALLDP